MWGVTSPSNAWCRIAAILLFLAPVALAEKPVVIFYRPPDCFNTKYKYDPCEELAKAVAHPAMQRRLRAVEFRTINANEGEAASIAIEDPSGLEVMRWIHMPDWVTLAEILNLIEHAGPYLLEAHRAAAANEPFVVERERALMALAFGDKIRGKRRLDAMRTSEAEENRELAAIWLERLTALDPKGVPNDDVFKQYAGKGSTERVRFEAWMALGDVVGLQGDYDAAIDAYNRAVEFASGKFARYNALAARQAASDLASPVVGLGPPGSVVAGRSSIHPRKVASGVASVEYRLDGKSAGTSRKAPFAMPINFGRIPRRQILEVISRNRAGAVVDRSIAVINERSEAFDVDFIEPRESFLSGDVQVSLAARVPRGRAVERLILEWNGKQIARFTAPPYRTRVNIPAGEQGLLRAVLRLDDGSEVEDVFMANAGMLLEAGAHLVEVPAYFESNTTALQDVSVKEAGTKRQVERVINPADAPLLIGLLIDSSSSMTPHLLDVQEAAVRFVEKNIEARDRTMIVSFSSNVRVLLRPSSDRSAVERSILAIHPKGGTALYDAMINGLLQLHLSGSRKAIVVFSDGLDGDSKFSSDDVAEVARRTGVPIYVLAFDPSDEARPLMALSKRTGGKAFEMKTLDGLGKLWDEIGADLRRQSLVIYRTATAGEEWRTLEITAKGRPVRAPSGVFVTAESAR